MEDHRLENDSPSGQTTHAKGGAWAIVAVACVILLLFSPNFAQYQLSPIAHLVMPQYNLDPTQFSALFSAAMIPGIALSLVSGLLCDRFGIKRMVGIAGTITAAALIARVFTADFPSLFVCMVFSGMVATFLTANTPKIMGMWFPAEKVGVAVGISIASGTLGMAVGMLTGALFPSVEALFVFTAVIATVGIAAWWFFFKEPPAVTVQDGAASSVPQPTLGECLKVAARSRNVWLVAVGLALDMATTMCLATFLPQVLQVMRGFDPASAGGVASVLTFGNLAGSVLVPFLNAKVGRMKPTVIVMAVVAATGAAFAWQLPEGALLVAGLFVTGICMSGIIISLMSVPVLLPEIGPTYAGTAGGIVTTLQLVGGVVIPSYIMVPLIGNNFPLFYIVAGVLCLAIAGVAALLPEVLRKA